MTTTPAQARPRMTLLGLAALVAGLLCAWRGLQQPSDVVLVFGAILMFVGLYVSLEAVTRQDAS